MLNDVTSGALRKRGFGAASRAMRMGGALKGFEFDDEDDADILARIKNRFGRFMNRDRDFIENELTGVEMYAVNPETARFAKCFQNVFDNDGFLSDEDDAAQPDVRTADPGSTTTHENESHRIRKEVMRTVGLSKSNGGSRSWMNQSLEGTPNLSEVKKLRRLKKYAESDKDGNESDRSETMLAENPRPSTNTRTIDDAEDEQTSIESECASQPLIDSSFPSQEPSSRRVDKENVSMNEPWMSGLSSKPKMSFSNLSVNPISKPLVRPVSSSSLGARLKASGLKSTKVDVSSLTWQSGDDVKKFAIGRKQMAGFQVGSKRN